MIRYIEDAVFICGCGHSGTSLIANMFANHPKVFIPLIETESFLIEAQVAERLQRLETSFLDSKKSLLVEKTPRHIHKLNLIRELIARPKFIMMVRDGRDVAASFIKRNNSALIGAERWLKDNRVVCKEADAVDTILVKYEDLITAPKQTLIRLCDFVGIEFNPLMLEYHLNERLWFGVESVNKGNGEEGLEHRKLRNWQINQPIFDGRGQWKTLLKADDLIFFESQEVKALMDFFNYD